MLKINFVSDSLPTQGVLILTVAADSKLGTAGQKLDKLTDGALSRTITAGAFTGTKEKMLSIWAPAHTKLSRILLVGIGDPKDLTEVACERLGGSTLAALGVSKETAATLWFDDFKTAKISTVDAAAHFAMGVQLRSYRFDKYRTKLKADKKPALKTLALAGKTVALKKAWASFDAISESVAFVRDVVNEPANVIFPESLAALCKEMSSLGVKVQVFEEKALKKLGMGALLAVAQGSSFSPRVVTMYWKGDAKAKIQSPIAFVGKGVTFDAGGISLKPAAGMDEMKRDMAGAAAVIGAIRALAKRKAKANVVGVVGLVENMPDGKAMRPGDILTSLSGQTIEVLNTDAEGRLVLADAIWYAQEEFKPRCMVDLATLTGAMKVAVGTEYAGIFSNDSGLSDKLINAGKKVDECLWALPLNEYYDKSLDSGIADIKNISDGSVGAGSSTGAHFIQRFVKKGTPWAHLDIASVAWINKDKPVCPKGSTAFGVRLLDRLISDFFEAK